MLNKYKYSKLSDKKILHKVRKHWVIVSLAMFVVLGGGYLSAQNVHGSNVQSLPAKDKIINRDSTKLHTNLIQSVNINKKISSNLSNQDNNIGFNTPSDTNWIYNKGKFISSSNTSNWINKSYQNNINLKYKYNPEHKAVEITDYAPDSYAYFPHISDLENANSIKFDDTINVNNARSYEWTFANFSNLRSLDLGNNFNTTSATSMANMFIGDTNLRYLNLGDSFNTSNVKHMTDMFNTTPSLRYLNLGNNFDTSNVHEYGCHV